MTLVTRRDRHRIYPTKEQIVLLKKILGCYRLIYNHCIDYSEYAYERGASFPGYYGKGGFACLITEMKNLPEI